MRNSGRVSGVLAGVALVPLGIVGLAVLLVALGAIVPGLWRLSGYATVLVPWQGPALVVVGLVVTLLAAVLFRWSRRAGAVVVTVAGAGTVALGLVVGIVVGAATQAGGSVDVPRAVAPYGDVSPPDAHPQYGAGPDGQPLSVAVYDARGATGPAPVLVYVHGGGWSGGSELDNSADMRWFADRGRVVISVGYTLVTPGRPTWDVAGPQVACALTQVAQFVGSRGGDPNRIVLAGDSAGGQLAISVAYHAASGTQASACGGRVPVPRGVLVQYPATDLVDAWERGTLVGEAGVPARSIGEAYLGGTPAQVPDRYRALSGVPAITPAAPPTLVFGPTGDELVPPGGVARFVDAARAAGIDTTLVRVPFANHAYDILGYGSLGNQLRRTVSEHWLTQRGW